jgi:uncharacterized protein (TIGR00645 family)
MDSKVTGIRRLAKGVETILFNVRWILTLFYMGLVAVMLLYGYSYAAEIYHLCQEGFLLKGPLKLDEMELIALDMVDIVMVANLIKMTMTGSYHSFISKKHGYANEAISSGGLKIKISTSILVVASIHLLKQFVTHTTWDALLPELATFAAFMLSALCLGKLEYWHIKGEVLEHEAELRHAKSHQAGHSTPNEVHSSAKPHAVSHAPAAPAHVSSAHADSHNKNHEETAHA